MGPQPNGNVEDNTNIGQDVGENVVTDFVIASEDEEQSSDENDIATYADFSGYKLLEQDDINGGNIGQCHVEDNINISQDVGDNKESDNHQNESDEAKSEIWEHQNANDFSIDYELLTCTGIDDELSQAGTQNASIPSENKRIGRDDNIEMNQDKVDLVKTVMAKFSLPSTNIPDWAKNLSEDKWKESIAISFSKKK